MSWKPFLFFCYILGAFSAAPGFTMPNGLWRDDWLYNELGLGGWDSNLKYPSNTYNGDIFHGVFTNTQGMKRGFETPSNATCIIRFDILFLCHFESTDFVQIRTPTFSDLNSVFYEPTLQKLNNSDYLTICNGNGTYSNEHDSVVTKQITVQTEPYIVFWVSFIGSFGATNEYFGVSDFSIQCNYEISTETEPADTLDEDDTGNGGLSNQYFVILIAIVGGILVIIIIFIVWYFACERRKNAEKYKKAMEENKRKQVPSQSAPDDRRRDHTTTSQLTINRDLSKDTSIDMSKSNTNTNTVTHFPQPSKRASGLPRIRESRADEYWNESKVNTLNPVSNPDDISAYALPNTNTTPQASADEAHDSDDDVMMEGNHKLTAGGSSNNYQSSNETQPFSGEMDIPDNNNNNIGRIRKNTKQNKDLIEVSLSKHEDGDFECLVCYQTFATYDFLHQHMKLHPDEAERIAMQDKMAELDAGSPKQGNNYI